MSTTIFECEQGSQEWFDARKGIPTASEFHTVMASSKGGGQSVTRQKYLYQLAGEIVTGEAFAEGYSNAAMERGKAMEAEARSAYAVITDSDLRRVGFVTNDGLIKGRTIGCSPDCLIGNDGAAEFKTQVPHLLIPRLLGGEFPSEHACQCQSIIWVAELKWIDLNVYWPKLPMFRRTVKRDDNYIARLKVGLETFFADLDEIVDKIRRYGKE
jgi:hypothetical protein